MRIFIEKQRFNQGWLYVVLIMVLIVIIAAIFKNSDEFTSFHDPVLILALLGTIIPIGLILVMQLETRIDQEGIRVKYVPLGFTEKFFSWKEIEQCYVRKYKPLTEYGGWGIRGLGRKKAYNVSGNIGIQIVRRDKKTFLIGTRKPEEARAVIRNFEHKIQVKSNKY